MTVNTGVCTLIISYSGYQSLKQQLTISASDTVERPFILKRLEQLDGVVVLGSRSSIPRSSMNSAVPIDVINGTKLNVAATTLTEKLSAAVPSFNAPPQTVGTSTVVSPATLRGLGPDETLVLVNGHRRHAAVTLLLQYNIGYGSVATDLNSIPAASVGEVQILRDGAAAQYGSDAIAGVIDIRLKKSIGITDMNLHTGQFYKGDGETISFDINRGIPFFKKGFLNFTAAARFSKPTQRNGAFDSTVYYNIPASATKLQKDSIRLLDNQKIAERGFNRLNHRPVGNPQLFNSSFVLNGGYPLNKKTSLFWTGTINYRRLVDLGSNVYRYPRDTTTVNTDLYPDGFIPKTHATVKDFSLIAGAEGSTDGGWNWDVSSTLGNNSPYFIVSQTNNATQFALGKNAQAQFDPGGNYFTQNTSNVNVSRNFSHALKNVKSFTVSFGGELRMENFRIRKGEEASWKDYAPGSGRLRGVQGVASYSDSNVVNKLRYVNAAYIELEMDKNQKFLWNLSGRYEHYSDFGNNLSGKLALRYKLSDALMVRGSASNGFRAPSMPQQFYSNSAPVANRNATGTVITIIETFRNDSRVAQAFGISQLQAERSQNMNAGVTLKISQHIQLTVDAFWIQINNKINLTGSISRSASPFIGKILDSLNKKDVSSIRFFTNATSTRTKGVEMVATGSWPLHKSLLEVSLSGSYNYTKIYQVRQPANNLPNDSLHLFTLVNPEERGRIEQSQPKCKIIAFMTYKNGKWMLDVQNMYFSRTAHIFSGADRNRDEWFTPKTLTGIAIGYSPTSQLTFKVGAKNIFSVYPDKVHNRLNTQSGLVIYDFNGTQIGYNGGYYFININLSW